MINRNTDGVGAALFKPGTGVPAHSISTFLAYRTVIAEVTAVLALPDAPLRSGRADLTEGTVAV